VNARNARGREFTYGDKDHKTSQQQGSLEEGSSLGGVANWPLREERGWGALVVYTCPAELARLLSCGGDHLIWQTVTKLNGHLLIWYHA